MQPVKRLHQTGQGFKQGQAARRVGVPQVDNLLHGMLAYSLAVRQDLLNQHLLHPQPPGDPVSTAGWRGRPGFSQAQGRACQRQVYRLAQLTPVRLQKRLQQEKDQKLLKFHFRHLREILSDSHQQGVLSYYSISGHHGAFPAEKKTLIL